MQPVTRVFQLAIGHCITVVRTSGSRLRDPGLKPAYCNFKDRKHFWTAIALVHSPVQTACVYNLISLYELFQTR